MSRLDEVILFKSLCNKAARIQYLKNENGWAKEEIVIEHVINAYTNFIAYNKSKAKVDTKIIKLQVLNEEINKNPTA